ncbi:MAG: DUF2125 domain-containing protein [Pseudomonadota bacterium]
MLSPLITVLVLWGLWSAYWFVLSATAQSMAGDWRQKVAPRGMSLTCDDENWGGYPFRIEIRCSRFRFTNKKKDKEFVARAHHVTAVAQAYKPWHVIVQFAPPLNLQLPARKEENANLVLSASHEPGIASIRLGEDYKPHVSILLTALKGDVDVEAGDTDFAAGEFSAASANVHLRLEETSSPERPVLGIAATIEALEYDGPVRDPVNAGPITFNKLTFDGAVEGLPRHTPGNMQTLLRRWVDNGGRLQVRSLNAEKTPVVAQASGTVTVDKEGRLNGKINATVQRLDHIIDELAELGRLSENDARVSKGLFKIMSGDRPKGEIVSDLRLKKGKLYFGPFKLMKIPPLF